MDPADRAAAEGRQAGRLGRPVSDLPHDLGETERRAWRAGWLLGHEEARTWHAEWEAGVSAYGRGAAAEGGLRRTSRAPAGAQGGPPPEL